MKNRYIQIFSFLIALLSFATFPACELDDKINFVTEGGINDVDTGSVDTGYVSLIDITDNTDADWKTLPAGYVASATHSNGCSLNGLKSVKVYSDQKYLNILVEVNLEVVTDRAWTPFHVYLNADGSDATGGYGDIFTDANTDIMLETAIYADGHAQYNPAVFKWWGEVGGSGWIWTNPNIESDADNCWGAIVCERSYPAVGYAQSVNADRSRIEIQILKERIPTQWANEFTIGFGIQQRWADVGVLPNAPDENGQRVANKLKVKTYMPHNTATYENGHEYVDLGLSVKWATCNVGANKPEDSGRYFAWGEATTKATYNTYNWSTYKWCNGSSSTLTKYCNNSSYGNNGFTDNKTQLELSDDAARANWGGSWRMPTDAEWTELRENCTWTWTTQNGVNGRKVTSKTNGNSIFLPAAGYRNFSGLNLAGSDGYYWSSSLNTNSPYYAWVVSLNSSDVNWIGDYRYYGQSVRPVLGESVVETTIPTVTTTIPTQITETTAVAGGNVTSDGGASVTERGVVYGKSPNPTISNLSNTIRPCGSGMGEFTYNMTDLQPSTTYYVRAYATNEKGTAYGEEESFTTNENNEISDPTGTENSYAYVDLGLSVKWATMNVGASKAEDYGSYFAWGETTTKDTYNWSTYKWCNGSSSTLTKYCNKSSYGNNGFTDNKTQLELSDDAARANWGGAWRMPTRAEQDELRENCTWTWTTRNGVNGRKVTSKTNGNSIFLPAAGYCLDSSLRYAGSDVTYWSSSLLTGSPYEAWGVYFNSSNVGGNGYGRYYGFSVRPVLGESVVETTIPTVTTTIPTQITETTAVAGGNVISNGNASVTERGVVYGTNQNPTTSNTKITAGSGTGSFTCNLTSLQENTTYYIRAYATNDVGTAYGEEVSFTTNGTENGYVYVDLGLSVKWATCNVGANNPEDYGDYFAWGETTTKDTYNWSTYKYCNGLYNTLTKYCNKNSYGNNGFTDNKTQLELSDDAAYVNWGGAWRMPTDAEMTELRTKCTWTWTTQNGVNGYKVTSKKSGYTNNSIFLPAAGFRQESSLIDQGSYGDYWSSSLYTVDPGGALYVGFDSGNVRGYSSSRAFGLSVRPVCP